MPSRTITLHSDAWSEVDEVSRRWYVARAAEMGATLRVGDTGLRRSEFLMVLGDDEAPVDPRQDPRPGKR